MTVLIKAHSFTGMDFPHMESANDMWEIDAMCFPSYARESRETKFRALVIQDMVTRQVICAKAVRWPSFNSTMVSDTLKSVTDDIGWPKYLCVDYSRDLQSGVRSLTAREKKIVSVQYLRSPFVPCPMERFFRWVCKEYCEIPFNPCEASEDEMNFWLDSVRDKYNAFQRV